MEHEIMQDTEEEESQDSGDEEAIRDQRLPGESDEHFLSRLSSNSESHDGPSALALFFSLPLNLPLPVAFLALNVAHTAENHPVLENSSAMSVAAASIYIASHILNEPRSLVNIARLTGVSERAIHIVYRAIYQDRYELIDENWCQRVGGTTQGEAAEALPSLTWPPLQHQFTTDSDGDDEETTEADNNSRTSGLGSLELVRELCFEFNADNVNALNPNIRIYRMAESIAVRMMAESIAVRMDSMALDWRTENPWTIAAACTYMASHLVSQRRTMEQVSVLSGIPSDWIRNTYQVMYRAREQIVQQDWYRNHDLERRNALYNLPGH